MSGEAEAIALAAQLALAVAELIQAAVAGDAEAERQAILRANRLTSDEIARRDAFG